VGAASAAYLQEFGGAELPPGTQAGMLPNVESVPAQLRRLDTIVPVLELPAPAALKIDIEGAEAVAVAGAESVLARWHPAILCEVHSVENALALADRLARLGYEQQVLGKNGPHAACLWSYGK
jgi:hypothetical protein